MREQIEHLDIIHEEVSIHNSEFVMPLIKDFQLDLIVFGGTRIIRGEILDYPKDGVINSHPGLLPDCRGSASPHGRFTMTSQLVHPHTSVTMESILRPTHAREIAVKRGMTYENLCYETLVLAEF